MRRADESNYGAYTVQTPLTQFWFVAQAVPQNPAVALQKSGLDASSVRVKQPPTLPVSALTPHAVLPDPQVTPLVQTPSVQR